MLRTLRTFVLRCLGATPQGSDVRRWPPQTHDFSSRGWGHDYTFTPRDNGYRGRVIGWCWPKPIEGDYLILRNGPGTTRYRVEEVEHPSAQGDMFKATVVFAPRSEPEPAGPREQERAHNQTGEGGR